MLPCNFIPLLTVFFIARLELTVFIQTPQLIIVDCEHANIFMLNLVAFIEGTIAEESAETESVQDIKGFLALKPDQREEDGPCRK